MWGIFEMLPMESVFQGIFWEGFAWWWWRLQNWELGSWGFPEFGERRSWWSEWKESPKEVDVGYPLTSMLRWHLLSCWVNSVAVRQENATAKLPLMVREEIWIPSAGTLSTTYSYYLTVHPAEQVGWADAPYSCQTCLQKVAAGFGWPSAFHLGYISSTRN